MPSSGVWRRVALVRTDVSEERIATIIMVKGMSELHHCTNIFPSSLILVTLLMEVIRSSDTSLFARDTVRHILEDGTLRSRLREDLKSYIMLMLAPTASLLVRDTYV
jgi:hypothetical protein